MASATVFDIYDKHPTYDLFVNVYVVGTTVAYGTPRATRMPNNVMQIDKQWRDPSYRLRIRALGSRTNVTG